MTEGKVRSLAAVATEVDGEGMPRLRFPDPFNVAEYFTDRHLHEGRGPKVAIRTLDREVTYAEFVESANRFGNALKGLGLGQGERVLMVVKDCPEFLFLFWGAIKAGVVPVPLNALLRAKDYEFIIHDSACAGLVYSPEYANEIETALASLRPQAVLRMTGSGQALDALARQASPLLATVPAHAGDDCYWLYTSGTTGRPKGVVHAHGDIVATCLNYTVDTLGAREDDVFFSVPRLYFAFGMGVANTGPLWLGATVVLDGRRPTPQTVAEVFRRFHPTIFAAVPTFYLMMLAAELLTKSDVIGLRRSISGGEATPPELQRRWLELTGVPITEGCGSTEAAHIYIASRIDDIRNGATGKPVPGYRVRIVDDSGRDVPDDKPGRLLLKGQSIMKRYWNDPEKTAAALVDGWLDTGDTYRRDRDGYYFYSGRRDDMLKGGGIWVAPFQNEPTLLDHPAVREAAVVGRPDDAGLVKAEAWVVLRNPADASDQTGDEIRAFCKNKLAPYKYPRWVVFVDELPKTATGKIQRFRLRAGEWA